MSTPVIQEAGSNKDTQIKSNIKKLKLKLTRDLCSGSEMYTSQSDV